MFHMWLSFATAFTSAFKSSDWTQKIIQVHDDSPLLSTDISTNNNHVGIQSNSLQSCTMIQNTVWMNFECEGKRKGTNSQTFAILCNKNWEGCDRLAIQSMWILDEQLWAFFSVYFFFRFLKNIPVAWKCSWYWLLATLFYCYYFFNGQESSLALTVIALPLKAPQARILRIIYAPEPLIIMPHRYNKIDSFRESAVLYLSWLTVL